MTLRLHGVTLVRGATVIVDGLDRDVPPGTIVAVAGTAGSGKTSVLDAIAGRIPLRAGTISLDGRAVTDPHWQGRIGVVTQAHDLVPTLTATENVVLGGLAAGHDPQDSWRAAGAMLDRLGLPESAQANLAEELSGGQHQRVAVARALASEPVLVLADDPTSELDEASVGRVVAALRDAADAGAMVVAASNEAAMMAVADVVLTCPVAQSVGGDDVPAAS